MSSGQYIDGVLVQWGERLFYPSNRILRPVSTPRLHTLLRRKAAVIRQRIEATVRRAPQAIVKVTGGGRGMGTIAAHFRYISKNGQLALEDDRGVARPGKEALRDLCDQWRYGGSLIGKVSHRREAFNLMLAMPAGTDADLLKKAARDFARAELAGHRYVLVLHEHQTAPHVHLVVKAESVTGTRLNPRLADLHRWRETFAQKLRAWGIEAEATRQATRGEVRNYEPVWRLKARQEGRVRNPADPVKQGRGQYDRRADAARSWAHITQALAASDAPQDRQLAQRIAAFLLDMPFVQQQVVAQVRDKGAGPVQSRRPSRGGTERERERMRREVGR